MCDGLLRNERARLGGLALFPMREARAQRPLHRCSDISGTESQGGAQAAFDLRAGKGLSIEFGTHFVLDDNTLAFMPLTMPSIIGPARSPACCWMWPASIWN